MKIGVCFSGQIRYGVEAIANIRRYIGDLGGSCDVFMHTWDISKPKSTYMYGATPVDYPVTYTDPRTVQIMVSSYNMVSHRVESHSSAMDQYGLENLGSNYYIQIPDHTQGLNLQFYSWNRSVELAIAHGNYDVLVKLRPDVVYHSECRLRDIIDVWNSNHELFYSAIATEDRVDDVIMCASPDVIRLASMTWHSKLANVGCVYEIAEHLKSHRIGYREIPVRYAPLRPQSLEYNTLTEFHKIYMADVRFYSGIDPATFVEPTLEDLQVIFPS